MRQATQYGLMIALPGKGTSFSFIKKTQEKKLTFVLFKSFIRELSTSLGSVEMAFELTGLERALHLYPDVWFLL
jgi:hypothetical protein